MEVKNQDVQKLIDRIIASKEFWRANYYARSMKKPPHGMVEHILWPNYFLLYKPVEICVRFNEKPEDIPYFLLAVVDLSMNFFEEMKINIEDLLRNCFEFEYDWYPLFRLLKPKQVGSATEDSMNLIYQAMCEGVDYTTLYDIDIRSVIYAFVSKLIKFEH